MDVITYLCWDLSYSVFNFDVGSSERQAFMERKSQFQVLIEFSTVDTIN